jgi:hypothetical protein
VKSPINLGNGGSTSVLICADGSVLTAGSVVGGATTPTGTAAQLVAGASPATSVAVDGAQATTFAILNDGTVVAWGLNDGPLGTISGGLLGPLTNPLFDSYLGLRSTQPGTVDTPVTVQQLAGVVEIQPTLGVLLARTAAGAVSIVPGNQTLDIASNVLNISPLQVTGLAAITSLGTPSQQALYFPVIDMNGNVTIITIEPYSLTTSLLQDVLGTQYTLTDVAGLPSSITQVACGDAISGPFCLALAMDGSVWAWGSNDDGELGTGTTTPLTTPAKVSGLAGRTIKQVAANAGNAYALASDGTVYAWGNPSGVGQSTSGVAASVFYVPNLVPSLANIVEIVARGTDVLVLDSQGNVRGWGSNTYGELGTGSTGTVTTPAKFAGVNLN